MNDDLNHLRLLSIFHYVVAGLAALVACVPILHLTIGIAMVSGAFEQPGKPGPPAAFGWFFIGVAGMLILGGWAFAVALCVAGYSLSTYRRHTFCLVMAALACMFQPFGTVLGVFTLIVLFRPSVKELFAQNTIPMERPEY